jgi:5-methylcytosine-specific restriction enzyme B
MADPICRWRNPFIKTVRELISVLPKTEMDKEDFRGILINSSFGPDFFTTPYQLACQLALYYEEDGKYFPRFTKNASIIDVKTYLNRWLKKYSVPNPYTKQGFEKIKPINVHSELCYLLHSKKDSIDWDEAKMSIFKEQIGNDDILINTINSYSDVIQIKGGNLQLKEGVFYEDLSEFIIVSNFLERNDKKSFFHSFDSDTSKIRVSKSEETNLDIHVFDKAIKQSGITIGEDLVLRFVSSLVSKPFVILTGLSGSGKTKLAQAFARWICENEYQYKIIPVGADWTNREPLFGYPNALESEKYLLPDNGTLSLILDAVKEENQSKPYFLILDEMNLSHVERYFADFLSAMESGEAIPLHNSDTDWHGVPSSIKLPKNLFVIGTVNIDETTYMFSPKVLDRANVIEFRVTEEEMREYLNSGVKMDLDILNANGAGMASNFMEIAANKGLTSTNVEGLNEELIKFFVELKKCGAEFGYRSASEINRFAAVVNKLEPSWELTQIIDAAIMQKLLPKVHGSRKKLEPVLRKLAELCLNDASVFMEYIKNGNDGIGVNKIKYPVSMEKIGRMYRALIENSFTSYAEA